MPIFKNQLSAKEVISKLSSKIKEEANKAKSPTGRECVYLRKRIDAAKISVEVKSDQIKIKIYNLDGQDL